MILPLLGAAALFYLVMGSKGSTPRGEPDGSMFTPLGDGMNSQWNAKGVDYLRSALREMEPVPKGAGGDYVTFELRKKSGPNNAWDYFRSTLSADPTHTLWVDYQLKSAIIGKGSASKPLFPLARVGTAKDLG